MKLVTGQLLVSSTARVLIAGEGLEKAEVRRDANVRMEVEVFILSDL